MHAPNASSTTAPTSTSVPVAIAWTSTRADAAPARRAACRTSAAATSTSVGFARPRRTPPSFALCGSSGASAFTATGNPMVRAAFGRRARRRDRALLRTSNAVELEQPRALRLVERTGLAAEETKRARAVRMRRQIGHRPGARALQVDQRADRAGPRAVSLQERQPRAGDESLARCAVSQRAHGDRREHDPGLPAQAGARCAGPAPPTRPRPPREAGTRRTPRTRRPGRAPTRRARRRTCPSRRRPARSRRAGCSATRSAAAPSAAFASSPPRTPGSSRPFAPAASANRVHAPPDCSAAATPFVRIRVPNESSTAASNIVTGSSTRIAPRPRSQASRSAVLPASAPVCATIDRRAASLRPSGAQTRTGLRAARSASSPRPIPSTSRIVSM